MSAASEDLAPWERGWWWSDQQTGVFDWFRCGMGNLIVRARAGTGKTTTIMEAITYARENRVLLAAFNKTIAAELQGRVPRGRRGVDAKTLHSLGFGFVRDYSRVRLDDTGERARSLTSAVAPSVPKQMFRLIKDLHTRLRDIDPMLSFDGHVQDVAEYAMRFELIPDEDWEARGWTLDRVCDLTLRAMKLAREPTDIIDFADMIFLPIVHGWVSPRYDLVVVDEAQDMTNAQLTIAVHAGRGRVCVVGDDRQAIYAFRGADSHALDRLKSTLGAAELGLNVTRRCPKNVVALAREYVPDFTAADDAPDGEVSVIAGSKLIGAVQVGDFVLSRKNAPLVRVCMELIKRGTPAMIRGNDIGKLVTGLIERLAAVDVEDLRVKVTAWANKECERARKRLPEDAADERVAVVRDQEAIVLALSEDCDEISDVNRRCASMFTDDPRGAVVCSSVHRAKGLEADNVYLLRDTFRFGAGVEESNLIYVAVTRAKQRLIWVEGSI